MIQHPVGLFDIDYKIRKKQPRPKSGLTLEAAVGFERFYRNITVSERAPWAPRTMKAPMSAVADGPSMKQP